MYIDELAKLQADADAELRLFQKLQSEYPPVEPLEVKPRTPYTESADFRQSIQQLERMEQSLREIHAFQEAERQARIDAEQQLTRDNSKQRHTDMLRFWITFVVTLIGSLAAVGSLIATIVLN